MKSKWMLRNTKLDVKDIAQQAGVNGLIAKILINRGITTPEKINDFLKTDLRNMHNPLLMKDMEKGVEIIKRGILSNKKIVVYGDYDCDGVTSTAILYGALKKCGADVSHYIPDREAEGYGMSKNRVRILKEEGNEIIITCDNGISAVEEVKYAKELGMTVVVTDHHELPFVEKEDGSREFIIPECDAVINPKQFDCNYPFKLLCGAGIALKFTMVLFEKFKIDRSKLREFLEYAAIGTICDVVDLIDENRIIAKKGLEALTNTSNIGLNALKEVLGLKDKEIKSYNVGFQIGPCINATGRLETADLSFEILTTRIPDRAKELANTLYNLNKTRQDMTTANVEEISEMVRKNGPLKDKVLVIYKKDVHESIAGIVAGRIREMFNLPTFVITGGKEMPKGSGRSIDQYNMFEEMIKCKELLAKFGGHPMAAGLSLEEKNIELFREKLNRVCELSEDDIIPKIRIDNRLPLEYLSYDIIEKLSYLEPFGKGNSKPVFAEKNIEILNIGILGKGNTLKLRCRIGNTNKTIDAICFNKVDEFVELLKEEYGENYNYILNNPNGLRLDLIFNPSINEFKGNKSIQLKIEDFRISS